MTAMTKKCAIITAYLEGDLSALWREYDPHITLCADGGYDHARAAGIVPDYLIGDLDSLKSRPRTVAAGENGSADKAAKTAGTGSTETAVQVITYPPEKDDTDTGLCIQAAIDLGCDDIRILGGIGGRLDHTIANIQLMTGTALKGVGISMADSKNLCTVLHNGCLRIRRRKDWHISILSLSESSAGVSLSGLKYPLSGYTMRHTFPLGVSNEFSAEEAVIEVEDGTLLIVLSRD